MQQFLAAICNKQPLFLDFLKENLNKWRFIYTTTTITTTTRTIQITDRIDKLLQRYVSAHFINRIIIRFNFKYDLSIFLLLKK